MPIGNGLFVEARGPSVEVRRAGDGEFVLNGVRVRLWSEPSSLPQAAPVPFGNPVPKPAWVDRHLAPLRWPSFAFAYFAFAFPIIGFSVSNGGVYGGAVGALIGLVAIAVVSQIASILRYTK